MSDNEFKKHLQQWETVLVEWASCLSLSKPLECLSDLQDGDFMIGILQLLTQSVMTLEETVPHICRFFKSRYPNFELPQASQSLKTLDNYELITVLSLVMHYTCVYDRRENFTSPLCSKLSEDHQLIIKSFLENFTSTSTHADLKMFLGTMVANNAIEGKTPRAVYQWQPAGDSFMGISPLQDFLRTPGKVGRIQQKDLKIKKLHHDLQMEKYEKEDLVMELKEHKEKIKRLSQQVTDKTLTVSKLQGELVAIENKTPPRKPREMQEIENLLKVELLDAKQYIEHLQVELDDLHTSKEIISKKLRKYEEDACLWQERALTCQNNFDSVSEKYKSQELQLSSLRLSYNELSALLEEMRASKINESCLEMDTSDGKIVNSEQLVCYEDLACSVVDVQLREVQRENTSLNRTLEEATQKSIDLEQNIMQLKKEFTDLNKNYQELQGCNEKLEFKIVVLKETQVSVEKSNHQLMCQVEELTEKNVLQHDDLVQLQSSLQETNVKLLKRDKLVSSLQSDLKVLQNNHEELQNEMAERNKSYEALQKESQAMQKLYEEAQQNYNEKEFQAQSLNRLYKESEKRMEQDLKQLEMHVCGSNELDCNDKLDAFKILLEKLEVKNKVTETEKYCFNKSLNTYQVLVAKLEGEIVALNKRDETNVETIQRITEELQQGKNYNERLEITVKSLEWKITKLNETINELNVSVSDLETLKIAVQEKRLEITLMVSENCDLKEDIKSKDGEIQKRISDDEKMQLLLHELEALKKNLQGSLDVKSKELEQVKQKNKEKVDEMVKDADRKEKEIQVKMKKMQDDYVSQNKDRLKNIHVLNSKIENYEKRIDSLEVDLKAAEDRCNLKSMELDELAELKTQLESKYEKNVKKLQKTINTLEMKTENLTKGIDESKHERSTLATKLEDHMQLYSQLRNEKEQYISQCENMRKEIMNLTDQVTIKENVCLSKDDIISKSNRELLSLKLLLENKHEEIKALKEKADILHSEKESAKAVNENLNQQLQSLDIKMENMSIEIDTLRKLKEKISREYDSLEANIFKVINQLGIKNDELVDAVEKLIDFRESGQLEITQLKTSLEDANAQLEQVNEDYLSVMTSHDKEMIVVTKTINSLNEELEALKTREIRAIQEIGILKDELSFSINKYTEAMEVEKDLRIENDTQITNHTENIHNMVEKYNELDTKHSTILENISESKKNLEEMTVIKQDLEMELVKQKQQYEKDFESAAEQYRTEFETLSSRQIKLENDIERLTGEVKHECSSKARIETELEKSKSDMQAVIEERAELLLKIESLIESNKQFYTEYNDLKIQHENYMKESKMVLSKTQLALEETIDKMRCHQVKYEQQIEDLEYEVTELTDNSNKKKQQYEADLLHKEGEINGLTNKIAELNATISHLETKQAELSEVIAKDKHVYSEQLAQYSVKSDHVKDLEIKITELHYAYDILETGKRKFEEMYNELLERYNLMCTEKHHCEQTYSDEIKSLELEIKDSRELMEEKVKDVIEKEKKIQEVYCEIHTINKIVNTMKEEKTLILNQKNDLEMRLGIIEEDNDRKIKEQIALFKLIKCKYEQLKNELRNREVYYEDLKQELFCISQGKNDVENAIKQREAMILELQNTYDSLTSILSGKDRTIASLQEELESKLEQVESISWEKRCLEGKLQKVEDELVSITKTHDDSIVKHASLMNEIETNLVKEHENTLKVKNELISRIKNSQVDLENSHKAREEIECVLSNERKSREFLELKLLEIKNDKFQHQILQKKLKQSIENLSSLIEAKPVNISVEIDFELLNTAVNDTEKRLVEIFAKTRELNEVMRVLENDKEETIRKLLDLEKCNSLLSSEKTKLLDKYDKLQNEKSLLLQEKDKETKCLENLQAQYQLLQQKYDETVECKKSNGIQNAELQFKLEELNLKNNKVYESYQQFIAHSKFVKQDIDKLISERNGLETVVFNLKENHLTLQIKSAYLTEDMHRLHFEQKQALKVIIEDIHKQFNRLSKMAYNINLNTCQIFEKTITGILTDKPINWQTLFNDLNIEEIFEKLEDLKDNAVNTLQQLNTFEKSVEVLNLKGIKHRELKENVQPTTATQKLKDEDWKKKYMNIKQRLTLIENAKNNYEKKIRQLREENKILSQNPNVVDNDVHYQNLLQQLIHTKDEHEKIISEYDVKYKIILGEFDQYKMCNSNTQLEHVSHVKQEVEKIREAYSSVLGVNSKLELENATLHKLLEDRNSQLSSLHAIKEAYEKLFEENNKLMASIDTLKYKRNRDRDEYVRLLKREKDEGDVNKKVQEVRTEYEVKLEKMKDKMIQLYKEEFDRQVEKVVAEKDQNIHLLKTIDRLKKDLCEANIRAKNVESEKTIALKQLHAYHQFDTPNDFMSLRDSMSSRDFGRPMVMRSSTQSLCGPTEEVSRLDDRRYSTLPKNIAGMDMIEEVRICRRTSITSAPTTANIEMEDEAELFNNKYLIDLKEGRCNLAVQGRESDTSRLSVLAYRNSLCPPHLQSSYPAETQFLNPRRFKDDDLKTGHLDMNDSMSTRLLPNEKPKKRDAGTTAYKRPGPPTPSKNGGRASLQGNEPHPREVLRDANEQKKTTPNRLKALFSRSKDSSENVPVTPKKRLSIFRKPR